VLDTLQGNRDITGAQLQSMRNGSFPHGFLSYKDKGVAAKLEGREKLGAGEAYVIVFEPAAGAAIRQYIDAQSFLPIRVDGVKIPFKLVTASSVQSFEVTFDKVVHNTAIDAKLFVKP
jgi:hypothetical protein